MNCSVVASADTKGNVDVYELSVSCPPYLGLDQTDAGRKGHTVKDATIVTDPDCTDKLSGDAVIWTACGELCEFKDENGVAKSKGVKVKYRNKGPDNASKSLNAEPLTAKVSIPGAEDVYCTTNFTVVKVDVSIGGTGEGVDETAPQNVIYSRELTKFAITNMTPVKVTCEPKSLPGMELVWLTLPDNVELFEFGEDGTAKSAKSYYRYNEIGGKSFGLLGRPSPAETADGWAPEFKKGYALAEHYASGAKDKGAFKVVPPPPLEITDVQFLSPNTKKNGAWPYDPVWDNPDYEPTVNGSVAAWCADNPGDTKVRYTLSRDAEKADIEFWKSGTFRDKPIDTVPGLASVGSHEKLWGLPKDLDEGNYLAKVVAIEAETGMECTAKSDEGELKRDDFYRSNAAPVMFYEKDHEVTLKEQRTDAGVRYWSAWAITIGGAAYAATFAEAVAAYLGVAAGAANIINDGVNFVGGAAIGYAIAGYSDITEVPQWLRYGVGLYDKKWTAWRMKWNETTRQYEEAKKEYYDKLEYDGPGNVKRVLQMTQNGRFEMGFERYMKSVETEDAGTQLGIINEGYYSLEWKEYSIGELFLKPSNMHGYDLYKKWIWGDKPYGLAQPIVKKDPTATK